MLLLLFAFLALPEFSNAQSSGRKREKGARRSKTFSLKRKRSKGNADAFARSSGRKGRFAKLFHKQKPTWENRSTGSSRANYKENRTLFSRFRTQGKKDSEMMQRRQNRERAKNRNHGNVTFRKRKYR